MPDRRWIASSALSLRRAPRVPDRYRGVHISAMHDVAPKDSGLASGLVGTPSMIGGSSALAILAASAEAWTRRLEAVGADPMVALIGGYHVAFATGAVLAVVCAALGLLWLPTNIRREVAQEQLFL